MTYPIQADNQFKQIDLYNKNHQLILSIDEQDPSFLSFQGAINKTKMVYGFLSASMTPIRLNHLSDLCCPTTVSAWKINSVTNRVLALLGAVFLDALTFPIRLVMMIKKIVMKEEQAEHPLAALLRQKNIQTDLEYVFVEEEHSIKETNIVLNDLNPVQIFKKMKWAINLKETPYYKDAMLYTEKSCSGKRSSDPARLTSQIKLRTRSSNKYASDGMINCKPGLVRV
ncbi:hypothetical protein [Candidatus Protochlamydia phocaeensis]|uniref:hypothetical protein n=1 Tax=Candidatus Protochlamydia phocaeensis TaxID=1414722 RepID=UPI0012AC3D28|nr:hypothetical protein [Candidatus Protochlamydia phocaeensis]